MTSRAPEAASLAGWLLISLALLALVPARAGTELAGHVSPYVAMHSDDPVDWRVWDQAVMDEARASGTLVFITSGYFSCYWCHVMQRESFRDDEIAEVLNRHYLAVVVDRELEPALDDYLIEFVASTRGVAGWPLNVIVTPDGYPLIGFTYLPRERVLQFLNALHPKWRAEREELAALAVKLSARLETAPPTTDTPVTADALRAGLIASALANADEIEGGFGEQSKFPTTPQLLALLELQARQPHAELRQFLSLTLENMATRGLYDLVGDGFFRYTVDPGWNEPHFEKMLYDNAQLARLYLRAARILDDARWSVVGKRTLEFLLREMRHPDGGFISSLSAVDDQGVEGAYYLWQTDELERVLEPAEVLRVRTEWRWVEPESAEASGALPVRRSLPAPTGTDELAATRTRLLRERSASRQLPRDRKQLAAWNALALSAFVEGARSDPQKYGAVTRELHASFVRAFLRDDQVVRTPSGTGSVTLADYALSAAALLDYSEVFSADDERQRAAALMQSAWQLFRDSQGWRNQARPLLPAMPARPVLADSTLPSASATLYGTIERLGRAARVTHQRALLELLMAGNATMNNTPFWHATQIAALP